MNVELSNKSINPDDLEKVRRVVNKHCDENCDYFKVRDLDTDITNQYVGRILRELDCVEEWGGGNRQIIWQRK